MGSYMILGLVQIDVESVVGRSCCQIARRKPAAVLTHFALAAAIGASKETRRGEKRALPVAQINPESPLARLRAAAVGSPQYWALFENGGGWPAPSRVFPEE